MICMASRAFKQSTKIVISLVRRHPSQPAKVITAEQPKQTPDETELPIKSSPNDPTLQQNKRNKPPVCTIHHPWRDHIQKASLVKDDNISKNISELKKLVTTVVVSKRKVYAVNPLRPVHDCAHVASHLNIAFNKPNAAESGAEDGYC